MEAEVGAALVAAVASLGVAFYQAISGQESAKKLARLQVRLDEMTKRSDARIAYEFDARKELYKSVEPLLFQLHEAAQYAWSRPLTLARDARKGSLDGSRAWLRRPGYYMLSTIHTLLVPVALVKLLRTRVNFVDVGLDDSVGRRYMLARALAGALSEDHKVAEGFDPKLDYRPNDQDVTKGEREANPAVFSRQGLPAGILDRSAEILLVGEGENRRVMSFGEFSARYRTDANYESEFASIVECFRHFHPSRRPVLWRVLLTQALLCEHFIKASPQSSKWANVSDFHLLSTDRKRFDWRQHNDEAPRSRVLEEPFQVAEAYVADRLRLASDGKTARE